jgi:hypothetical protein
LASSALAGGALAGGATGRALSLWHITHLPAHHLTGLAGLGDPLFGDLTGHAEMLLKDGELLLGVLLKLRVLLMGGLVLSDEHVFFMATHLIKDERAVELCSLLLLEFLELGLVDLVHLLRALLAGLLGKLLELLLGALVVLREPLGKLLDLLVLAVLLDELAGLNLELVVAGCLTDALLDVLGAHFFTLILLILLCSLVLLCGLVLLCSLILAGGGAALTAELVLLGSLNLAVAETCGGRDGKCGDKNSFHGKPPGRLGDGGEGCDDTRSETAEDVGVWGLASCSAVKYLRRPVANRTCATARQQANAVRPR